MEYEESKAIEYIREHALKDAGVDYDDDEILNIIDMIFDYYEQNGMLDLDLDDDADEDDQDAIVDYVKRMVAKDKGATLDPALIPAIVAAEIAYEESLI